MSATGILLCAGASERMGFDKLNTPLLGKTAIERSMDALVAGGCDALVFVVNDVSERTVRALACPVPFTVVKGGETATDDATLYARAIGAPRFVDGSEDIADFTVVSVTYDGLGDVTNIEYN